VFDRVGVIAKIGDRRVIETVAGLLRYLEGRAAEVVLDAETARELTGLEVGTAERARIGELCDLVIIVGGDGTFLHAARSLESSFARVVGINMGRLGFLSDIVPSEMRTALDDILAGNFIEEERFLLQASVLRDGGSIVEASALNDVVAHKWHIARLLQFETFIDSRLVHSQRSDGLIVSTPTGSTAYALSSGGPIMHPALDAIVLVPICPHTLSARPIVVDANSHVEIVLTSGDQPEAQLTCDGQTTVELASGDRISVRKRPHPLRLVHPPGHDYYATLRAKLHWGREI